LHTQNIAFQYADIISITLIRIALVITSIQRNREMKSI
jgi:hypothetical protein